MTCTRLVGFNMYCPALASWWRTACLLVALCLLQGSFPTHARATALELRDDLLSIEAWSAVTVLPDPTGTLLVNDVLAELARFQPPPGTSGTLGVRAEPVWVRIPVTVPVASNGLWVLDIDYPVLQRIEVYLAADGHVTQQATLGSLQPYTQRPLRSRTHALPLTMLPGHAYELLLRVETRGAMVLPITLNKPTTWHSKALNEQMLQGILTGLALCLLIYSLAQWLNLRDVLFIQYALLITGSLLFSLHLFGLGTQYLWRDMPWMELHAASLAALTATCGSFLFISQALAGDRPRSKLLRSMRGGAVLCVVLAALYALDLLSTRAVTGIVSILGLVPALMGIPGAVRRARLGDPVGSTLLLAWLVYFLATATVIGVIQGWVPVNFWTLHSFQFGATLDMLLFMRVLGLRTKALRLEALDANRERDVMRSLAHTDPLTGLPNRRGLNISLASALSRCSAEKMLAVYVMDLDGFKPVNDQHGHDVGDELLVAVTRRLQGHVRQSDLVARLGGDEFVVMAGQLQSLQQAQELGHKLLDAFRSPFSLNNVQVEIGLTIGYAIAPHDSTDAIGLLKLADAAMYSGKQGGKFCLRRNTGDLALSSA
ncbi:diguanylate cyclase (GGDEF)-like protein [Acidovorax delafieldii]|uniref:Diguanylate cyclase (GGDEF)-like protein n=1 Tax=Acidovorax delafieldii TaxID=47920 RepID=A0AAJ2CA96_ACIDE|nr:diguanylate cyclase [Acidovorax delafieldii]MDR6768506.1 diguanylate cyclase (GGDEF)-like protein [Acidovorax delafieldii]MDR6837221.1 diguanylate cyclase (GGDEF)-like protein [Acidovorax delafieldii]MDR7366712.1 diguanylate cyclase (GGDEF)-like protein [Acidovorax delafieldii]